MSIRDSNHPYYFLKKVSQTILIEAGYCEESEELMPQLFGSAITIFRSCDRKIRIIWDGKDGWGYAQDHASEPDRMGNYWVDIDRFLTEADIETVPQNDNKINEFRSSLLALLKKLNRCCNISRRSTQMSGHYCTAEHPGEKNS